MRFSPALALLAACLPSALAATVTVDLDIVNGEVAPDGFTREYEIVFSLLSKKILTTCAVLF